jgi:hypothetical protein
LNQGRSRRFASANGWSSPNIGDSFNLPISALAHQPKNGFIRE